MSRFISNPFKAGAGQRLEAFRRTLDRKRQLLYTTPKVSPTSRQLDANGSSRQEWLMSSLSACRGMIFNFAWPRSTETQAAEVGKDHLELSSHTLADAPPRGVLPMSDEGCGERKSGLACCDEAELAPEIKMRSSTTDVLHIDTDPYGIEEAYRECELALPDDDDADEFSLGTMPKGTSSDSLTHGQASLLATKDALICEQAAVLEATNTSLQVALRRIVELEAEHEQAGKTIWNTRKERDEAEDKCSKLEKSLRAANTCISRINSYRCQIELLNNKVDKLDDKVLWAKNMHAETEKESLHRLERTMRWVLLFRDLGSDLYVRTVYNATCVHNLGAEVHLEEDWVVIERAKKFLVAPPKKAGDILAKLDREDHITKPKPQLYIEGPSIDSDGLSSSEQGPKVAQPLPDDCLMNHGSEMSKSGTREPPSEHKQRGSAAEKLATKPDSGSPADDGSSGTALSSLENMSTSPYKPAEQYNVLLDQVRECCPRESSVKPKEEDGASKTPAAEPSYRAQAAAPSLINDMVSWPARALVKSSADMSYDPKEEQKKRPTRAERIKAAKDRQANAAHNAGEQGTGTAEKITAPARDRELPVLSRQARRAIERKERKGAERASN